MTKNNLNFRTKKTSAERMACFPLFGKGTPNKETYLNYLEAAVG